MAFRAVSTGWYSSKTSISPEIDLLLLPESAVHLDFMGFDHFPNLRADSIIVMRAWTPFSAAAVYLSLPR